MKEKRFCELCGNELTSRKQSRFCSKSCASKWKATLPHKKPTFSEEQRLEFSKRMKERWEDPKFRENNYIRMTTNNPVYQDGVIEKTRAKRIKNGGYKNNFKYGNGKISVYEQIAWETLKEFGYEYNRAISTNELRKLYPDKQIATNYKPDFVNIITKICIEIDGNNHLRKYQKELDKKKDWCLEQLGYVVFRFTHSDIDNGTFGKWVKKWLN